MTRNRPMKHRGPEPHADPPVPSPRTPDALLRLVDERARDVRELDLAGFRRWLGRHLERWQGDPVFEQRSRIRDLYLAHPHLAALREEERRAAAADAASDRGARLEVLERELTGARKAVAGVAGALEGASPERRAALRRKLEAFRARRRALGDERAELIASSPERQELLRVRSELARLRDAVGLDREEARLAELLKRRGGRAGGAGASFERLARTAVERHLVPELQAGGASGPLRLLEGVTLGAARVELDLVVVREPSHAGDAVEVLAVVEAKRNPNDLGHGFRQRQENLAWLTGAGAGHDPALYRTRRFASGHFDRPAIHREGGAELLFDRGSFRRFLPDPATGLFLDRLCLVSREGPLWGVSGSALARIGHRVATDPRWRPESDAYMAGLLRWCRSLAEPIETPDVLRLYAATPGRARRMLLASG